MRKRKLPVFVLLSLVGVVLLAPPLASAAVSVSGYVLTLVKWEDKIAGHNLPRLGVSSTPLDPPVGPRELDHNQFGIDARQSRVVVSWTDDVQGIKMSGRIETDFNTTDGNALTSNSRHLRLRLAYARADHPSGFFLLAGQHQSVVATTDIAFMGKYAVDEFNTVGDTLSGVRQPQVRGGWTTALAPGLGNLTLEASVEANSAPNLGSTLVDESQGEGQTTPAFGGRITLDGPIVRIQGGGLVAKETETLTGGHQESENAWVVFGDTEVKPPIIPGLTLFGHVHTQKGLGRFHGGAGDFPSLGLAPVGCTTNCKIQLIKATSFYAGVSYKLTPTTQFDAYYGYAKADQEPSIGFTGNTCPTVSGNPSPSGACLKDHQSYHFNVIQNFWQRWRVGLEYKHYYVKAFSGAKGDFNMVEAAIYYFF